MSSDLKSLVKELDGYLDIGMREQCIPVVRAILRHPDLDAEAFDLAVFAIVDWDIPEINRSMRPVIDRAYARLKPKERVEERWRMSCLYSALNDQAGCLKHATTRPSNAVDARISMNAYLAADESQKSGTLAEACARMLGTKVSDYDANILHYTLANFYLKHHRIVETIAHLKMVHFPHPHWDDALHDRIQVSLLLACETVDEVNEQLALNKKTASPDEELTHAGLQRARIQRMEQDAEAWRKGLYALLKRKEPRLLRERPSKT